MSQFTEVEKPIKPHVDNRDSKSSASRRKNEGNHQAYLFDQQRAREFNINENEDPNTPSYQINDQVKFK